MKAFFVDDSAAMRESLTKALRALANLEIIGEASSVAAAHREIKRLLPDLVVLDYHLPDGTGLEVLRRIKEHSPRAVVLMNTLFATPQHRAQCLAAGADYFFEKSTEFAVLVDTVRALAAGKLTPQGITPNCR